MLFSICRNREVTPAQAVFRPCAYHEDLRAEQVFMISMQMDKNPLVVVESNSYDADCIFGL